MAAPEIGGSKSLALSQAFLSVAPALVMIYVMCAYPTRKAHDGNMPSGSAENGS